MNVRPSVTGLAMAVVCALGMYATPSDAYAEEFSSSIKSVVDGDTVHLNEPVLGSTKVRLVSIDTPETNYQGKSQGKHAEEATDALAELLPVGTPVTVETDVESKDQYGRLLGHLHKEDLDINREMVRRGHAATYYIWPNTKYFSSYQSALLEAQAAGAGMWNPQDPIKELPFEFRLREGNREPDKFVGNEETKQYVKPADYGKVPMEHRVFFFTEAKAQEAGYTPVDGGDEPDEPDQPNPDAKDIVINEVLPDPSKLKNEFVELYNPNEASVDISGYVIDDIAHGGGVPYTIPEGTRIPGKGYYVWETNNFFNNSGDDVTLKNANDKIIDAYHYHTSFDDASWIRFSDGKQWSTTMDVTPTKGAKNQFEVNIKLNEVLPDPDTKFSKEFVEIYNAADTPVDLGGYVIDDLTTGGGAPYTIPEGTIVEGKGYYVWEPINYFNNGGDDVTLLSPQGTILDQFHYSSSRNDHSWVRFPDGGDWDSAMNSHPTKGGKNQREVNLVINEVLPQPDQKFSREFVELYNAGEHAVDIGGYVLDDIIGEGSKPFTIPEGTIIPAKGYYVWEPSNVLNNTGDQVNLLAPDQQLVDSYQYGFSKKDQSWARLSDGGAWSTQPTANPTKNKKN